MGTYENFYLNQIKQLQEENKKLKQIIDEGLVDVAVRGLEQKRQRDIEKLKSTKLPRRPQPGYGIPSDSPAPVVPGRSDPEGYASDDMESRRTQPGYGPSSDSQGAGPKSDLVLRPEAVERIRRAREGDRGIGLGSGFSPKLPHRERVRRARERGFDVDGYRF
jgi:hypothetical protein